MPLHHRVASLVLLTAVVLALTSTQRATHAQSPEQRLIREPSTVTTVAGGGAPGYRDGAAVQALFNRPRGLAIDAGGALYVADQRNDRVRMITPDGTVSTYAGPDDGAGPAPVIIVDLQQPVGLGFDAENALYVAEYNRRVWRLPPGQPPEMLVDFSTLPEEQTWRPGGINSFVVTGGGVCYFTTLTNGAVRSITRDGALSVLAGSDTPFRATAPVPASDALYRPWSLAVDGGTGHVYVTDEYLGRLLRIAPDGKVTRIRDFRLGLVATDRHGVLHVFQDGTLYRVSQDGELTSSIRPPRQFLTFDSLAVGNDAYFLSGSNNGNVFRVGFDGAITALSETFDESAAGVDGQGDAARFPSFTRSLLAVGTVLSTFGTARDGSIRVIDPDGTVTTVPPSHDITGGTSPDLATLVAMPDGRIFARSRPEHGDNLLACTLEPTWQCTLVQTGPLPNGHIVAVAGEIVHLVELDTAAYRIHLHQVSPAGVTTLSVGDGVRGRVDGMTTEAQVSPVLLSRLDSRRPVRDVQGNVYVVEDASIRRISSDGTVSTLIVSRPDADGSFAAADGPLSAASLVNTPESLAVTPAGDLLFFDDSVIRRISSTGMVTTIAGTPARSGYRDGAGEVARFDLSGSLPSIAVTSNGTIYVGDFSNHRIRRIDVHAP